MINYGSDIRFEGTGKSKGKGQNYKWIASASTQYPDTIIINKHKIWIDKPLNYIIKKTTALIPHETIHNILWANGLDPNSNYDIVRNKILHRRRLSDKIHGIYYRCT